MTNPFHHTREDGSEYHGESVMYEFILHAINHGCFVEFVADRLPGSIKNEMKVELRKGDLRIRAYLPSRQSEEMHIRTLMGMLDSILEKQRKDDSNISEFRA